MEKPRLSFWDIWNMSFGFLGIQFGFALQNANVSRIFETLGARVENIPILWIAAPTTGLIVQPIVGYFSDRTWNRLGRRRPYFLGGALLASLALIVMPNSPVLWVAAGMLWIMDASINISMEPFRAFVGDNLPSAQRTTGFALQSFFIGTGAVVSAAVFLPDGRLVTGTAAVSDTGRQDLSAWVTKTGHLVRTILKPPASPTLISPGVRALAVVGGDLVVGEARSEGGLAERPARIAGLVWHPGRVGVELDLASGQRLHPRRRRGRQKALPGAPRRQRARQAMSFHHFIRAPANSARGR